MPQLERKTVVFIALALLTIFGTWVNDSRILTLHAAGGGPGASISNLQPVSFKLSSIQNTAKNAFTIDGPAVPNGRRLVVEDVSVYAAIPQDSALTGVLLLNKGGDNQLHLTGASTERTLSGNNSIYSYNRTVKAYFNAGDVIEAQVYFDSLVPGAAMTASWRTANVYVHGYYVNVP